MGRAKRAKQGTRGSQRLAAVGRCSQSSLEGQGQQRRYQDPVKAQAGARHGVAARDAKRGGGRAETPRSLSPLPTSEPAEKPASGGEAALTLSLPGLGAGQKRGEREPEWVGRPREKNQHM